jgi:hypothetical protein
MISRVAAGAYVLCHGAAEAILGIAAGVLVQYANVAPENEELEWPPRFSGFGTT